MKSIKRDYKYLGSYRTKLSKVDIEFVLAVVITAVLGSIVFGFLLSVIL